MNGLIGQIVLKRKHKLSHDESGAQAQCFRMHADNPASTFNDSFIERTKAAREAAGLTQEGIATILGIRQDTYKQYETRSPLPHRFVPAFCAATRITEKWLFTGRQSRAVA